MEKIVFDREKLINLSYSLNREFLRTNGKGVYATTSLCLCNTRKYHGLFIAPQKNVDDEFHVLLSSLDETIIQQDIPFHLALHRYKNGVYYPKGHKYLTNYKVGKTAQHTYSLADIQITKEFIFSQKQGNLIIKYSVEKCDKPFKIQFNPLLAFRSRHTLTKSNSNVNTNYDVVPNGVGFCLYENYDNLFIQFSKDDVEYNHNPMWYYDFEYIKEEERGYDFYEDLISMGYFQTTLKKGDTLYISVSTKVEETENLKSLYSSELRKLEVFDSFPIALSRAAKKFFVEKDNGDIDILAGYPWFGRWGRDSFISLFGLCLGINDFNVFIRVIDTLIKDVKNGLFPNIGSQDNSAYNSVDAPMWFFWAMQQYCDYTHKEKQVWKKYKDVFQGILRSYRDGTNENIRMMPNNLIWAQQEGKALTWMDAIVNGNPVTQRKGMCVEINALWYNAIMFCLSLARISNDKAFISEWEDISMKIPEEFKNVFWNKSIGWLADYVDGYYKDFSIRCNMIVATSLKYRCISNKICQLVVDRVKKELLTPFGLRTLSPTHSNYHQRYEGGQEERDEAYHQGTVWVWLLSHFVESYLRIYGVQVIEECEKLYLGFENALTNYGIGGIAEVFDGNPPHKAGGSIYQAWSVSEVIRIKYLIDLEKSNNMKKGL
ncbi:MAG: amylo-alpha-1,6-glucosidase [Bacteroidales bacterium]|jgi:predicted glycogen debranching enzyme|nr:amylo-alpha-1,6-glucosidase [Bacteroidales bacterium]